MHTYWHIHMHKCIWYFCVSQSLCCVAVCCSAQRKSGQRSMLFLNECSMNAEWMQTECTIETWHLAHKFLVKEMVCCSVLQCVAVCTGFASVLINTFHVLRELYSSKETHTTSKRDLHSLQCVAACSVLQRVAVCCSVLQCIAACCIVAPG